MDQFEARLQKLDIGLFSKIVSQSGDGDKRSWLALQRAVRDQEADYAYLEIGSYLGGSIQPYLADPKCRCIYSIDARESTPDERGVWVSYEGLSEERMKENLRRVDAAQMGKLTCFRSDSRQVDPNAIAFKPALCFIDGEHTRTAVLGDFEFCRKVAATDSVIYFHDDIIVHQAISEIVQTLKQQRVKFAALKLGDGTFALGFGRIPLILQRSGIDRKNGLLFLRYHRFRANLKGVLPAGITAWVGRALRFWGRLRIRG